MKCKNCHVTVSCSLRSCPLCHGDLTGDPQPEENVFPNRSFADSKNPLLRLVATIALALLIVLFSIGRAFPDAQGWMSALFAGVLCLWLSLYFIIKNRRNLVKNILFQAIILCLILDSWDSYFGWTRWAVTYATPAILSVSIVSIWVIAKRQHLSLSDYILYLLFNCCIGIFSFSYITSTMLTVIYPNAICFVLSMLTIILTLLYERNQLFHEIRKRFHL